MIKETDAKIVEYLERAKKIAGDTAVPINGWKTVHNNDVIEIAKMIQLEDIRREEW